MEDQTADEVTNEESGGSRRDLFAKAGAAAAVAAVAGLAVSKTAEAADTDPITVGDNTGSSGNFTTTLSGGSSFRVLSGETGLGNQSSIRGVATSDEHSGVRGEASGSDGYGVYGISSGSGGNGVRGSNSGSDGSGVYGVTDANGTGGGGVYGRNDGNGHGVKGFATNPAGAGVYGLHTDPAARGVYGHHDNSSQSGTGVLGVAALGVGVDGRGSQFDLRAGSSGRLGLDTAGNSGSKTDTGTVGTIARDSDGNLWYCYATDKWEQLSGVVAPATPPQFTAITPIRAYDGRIPAIPNSGTFAPNSDKVISIKDGRDQTTGIVDAANAVPSGAKAVAYNVTAANATSRNFLSVVPGNVASSAVSSLNVAGPGAAIANAGIVGVDGSRQIRIIAGPGGSFDAIVDITGYFS